MLAERRLTFVWACIPKLAPLHAASSSGKRGKGGEAAIVCVETGYRQAARLIRASSTELLKLGVYGNPQGVLRTRHPGY
ncbi:hypothetical protein F4802DRAFT_555090 [Xylaria palmicola]|nr:hypothetical protein F4802DRAFT_555090 [Xylaria palmicola]